jgi:hypothetical protein
MPSRNQHRQVVDYNVSSWQGVFQKLCQELSKVGQLNPEIIVPAKNLPEPQNARTLNFARADIMSLNKGAEKVYRDSSPYNSLQVRIYNDGEVDISDKRFDQPMYHIQLDGRDLLQPLKGLASLPRRTHC